MEKRKIQKMLLYFIHHEYAPPFGKEYQRQTFMDLQQYDLIRIDSTGKVVITENGKRAIDQGVMKHLRAIEFEEELAAKAPKLQRQKKMLIGIICLLLFLLVFLLWSYNDFPLEILSEVIEG